MIVRFLIIVLAMVASACSTSPTGRSQFMIISPQAAIVQSQKAYADTVKQLGSKDQLSSDHRLADRVQRITGRLVTTAHDHYPSSRSWDWSVALIDDPDTVNAWCMAGGRMAVYTGLFEQLKLSDDEFAQIMGHEIAHALANHTAEQMSRAVAMQIGLSAISAASDGNNAATQGAQLAAVLALQLPNSRTAESEADTIGLELATLAGYDPQAAVSLWRKMGDLNDKRPPEFLSTHPDPSTRLGALELHASEVAGMNPKRIKAPIYPINIVYQKDAPN
ncbi:MAG: M48 family metallopeptidase [Halieaceae bacterium]|nr:M48 family metallopeptidase [Halieaceae bacterium]